MTRLTNYQEVIEAEREHIGLDSRPADAAEPRFTGLALSGGGIRSASFCLGVLQALVAGKVLPKIDYLSTVSGGGYIGSSLTWFLSRQPSGGGNYGTTPENFPFGRPSVGARSAGDGAGDNRILDFIRQHGNYLFPGRGLSALSALGVMLRAVTVSLLVYFAMLCGAAVLLYDAGLFQPLTERLPAIPLVAGYALFAVFVLIWTLYSILSRFIARMSRRDYPLRTWTQRASGITLGVVIALLVAGSLPHVYAWLQGVAAATYAAASLTTVGSVLAVVSSLSKIATSGGERSLSTLIAPVAAVLVLYGIALGAYTVAENSQGIDERWIVALWLILGGAVCGALINVNYLTPHRMYRDRLMEAFMPNFESLRANVWAPATDADAAEIAEMCPKHNRRPYHLINTNVVLVASRKSKFRGRGGDNFLLSPLYCGSDATGWVRSDSWMQRGKRGMTLATAMAISGAAANPNAGVSGAGLTRNRLVSALMTLLNIRLGYWAPNPSRDGKGRLLPNLIFPALRVFVGSAMDEERRVVELTDGGHFENLALYELVRRRVKQVIVCDAGCDPKLHFEDLANATERIRVDFGVKISFDDPALDLRWLRPGAAVAAAPAGQAFPLAERGFAIGTIHYPGTLQTGTLIYIKPTMTAEGSTDVHAYKAANPEFPHETTADQFFDEPQLEAYRELGYYLGWQMLEANGAATRVKSVQPGQSWI